MIDVAVASGEFKNDPNAVLMTIADLSVVWLTASVQEKDVGRVRVGDEASAVFSAYPSQTFSGKVFFVADLLDLDTRTIKVRVAFDNADGRLKPGMFATVRFASSSIPRVVVPTSALVLRGDESYAYVQVGDWVYQRGTATLLEVLDSQRTVNEVYLAYYDAISEYAKALAAVETTSGVWDIKLETESSP